MQLKQKTNPAPPPITADITADWRRHPVPRDHIIFFLEIFSTVPEDIIVLNPNTSSYVQITGGLAFLKGDKW